MLQNGFYNLIGAVIRLALGIVSVPLLIQLLGAESYGLYTILLAIINLAALSEWSISMILTVFLSGELARNTEIEDKSNILNISLLIIVLLIIITAIIIYCITPFLGSSFGELSTISKKTIQQGCQLSIIIVACRLFHQFFIGIEQAYNEYKILNKINTSYHIIQTGLILFVAWFYHSVLPIIVVQVLISSIFVFVHAVICYKINLLGGLKISLKGNWTNFNSMLKYGSKTYLGVVGSALFSQGDRLLIGHLLGLESAGIYAAIKGIVVQINSLSSIPVQPIVPAVSMWFAQKEDKALFNNLKIVIQKAISLNVLMAIGVGGFLLLVAPELSVFMFKNSKFNYNESLLSFQIIVIIYTLYSLNAVGYYVLFAIKKEGVNTTTTLCCGSLSLLLIGLFGEEYGLLGAIYGNAAYLITLYLIFSGFKSINIPLRLFITNTQKQIVLFLCIGICTFFWQNIIVRAILGVLLGIVLLQPMYPYVEQYFLYYKKKINILFL